MEESESRDRNNVGSTIDFQGRKKQLKGTSVSIRKQTNRQTKTPNPKHIIDDFRNHTIAKEIMRKGVIWWHMTWAVHELLEKKKGVDRVMRRKRKRKIAVKRSHTGKNGKKWCNAKKKFSHFLSRQRDSSNLQQDQTPPRDAISVTACLNNYNLSRDFFTSGKTAWKGGSLLLWASCATQKKAPYWHQQSNIQSI